MQVKYQETKVELVIHQTGNVSIFVGLYNHQNACEMPAIHINSKKMLDQAIHYVWPGPAFLFNLVSKCWQNTSILHRFQKKLDRAIQNVQPGPAFVNV